MTFRVISTVILTLLIYWGLVEWMIYDPDATEVDWEKHKVKKD